MTPAGPASPWRERLLYLVVGGWNTVFGFGLFWLLHALCTGWHYLPLLLLSNEAAILNAFVGYRWLVFRSRGPFWRELLRFHAVYLATAALGVALTAALVEGLGLHPVAANACTLVVTVVGGYLAHRHWSFG